MFQLFHSASALAIPILAQATVGENGHPIKLDSVWDFVVRGGPTMIAIGLCSLVALTVVVERFVVLRRRNVIPKDFFAGLKAVQADRKQAMAFCEANKTPVAQILHAAIRHRGKPIESIEKAVRDAGSRVMVELRRRMRMISALPQVATMLGLLGTIFGMIKTFQAVAASGQNLGKAELLAKGIFEAWTNTAAGLFVAIPVLILYQTLMSKIDHLAVELDKVADEWVEQEAGAFSPAVVKLSSVIAPAAASNDGAVDGSRVALATA